MKDTICLSTSIIIPMLQAAGELPAGPVAYNPAHAQPSESKRVKATTPASGSSSPDTEKKQS